LPIWVPPLASGSGVAPGSGWLSRSIIGAPPQRSSTSASGAAITITSVLHTALRSLRPAFRLAIHSSSIGSSTAPGHGRLYSFYPVPPSGTLPA
jgi:hypothetical protein